MTEPRRLSEEDRDPVASALLRAAQTELPPTRSVERTLAAIATGSALMGASQGATAAWGAKLTTAAVVKWASIGVIAGIVAVGTVDEVRERWRAPPSRPTAAGTATAAAVEPLAPAPALEGPAVPRLVASPDEQGSEAAGSSTPQSGAERAALRSPRPSAKTAVAGGPASDPPEAAPSVVESELAAEVALLDVARRELNAGRSSGALAALRKYRTETKTYRLDPEARYLELEARILAGDGEGARHAAEQLVKRYPHGPHAARAGRILRDQSPAGEGLR